MSNKIKTTFPLSEKAIISDGLRTMSKVRLTLAGVRLRKRGGWAKTKGGSVDKPRRLAPLTFQSALLGSLAILRVAGGGRTPRSLTCNFFRKQLGARVTRRKIFGRPEANQLGFLKSPWMMKKFRSCQSRGWFNPAETAATHTPSPLGGGGEREKKDGPCSTFRVLAFDVKGEFFATGLLD